ncbi:MAG: hypothetical protein HFJ35_05260 [Clostridia bacterium]|nr:hypothetical protein [Clostridia bacterium]
MKRKIFKISVILVMILTMTMTNFIFVGKNLISYAVDNVGTNHKNVEFKAYFKDGEGKEAITLEKEAYTEETFLYLRVDVKKEGYFNGEIVLEDSNFTLKESDSAYVNKIENNTIYLNQINVGVSEEIKVKVEPITEENFTISLLNKVSKISIKGIYRDSTEKDINIQANREVEWKLVENNTNDSIQNEMRVITNKVININGEEKRVLQLSYFLGLKENNYPIQEIYAGITIPEVDGKQAEIEKIEHLNNMTSLDYQYKDNQVELTLENPKNNDNKVVWKKQGNENVILTCLYDKEVEIEDMVIKAYEKVILHNGKEIEIEKEFTVGSEELDTTLEVSAQNLEETIYKGKLKAGIDRPYQSITQMKINYAKALTGAEITEGNCQYIVDGAGQEANVIYSRTIIQKELFDELLGQDGSIMIKNQNGEEIATITNTTPTDEAGNMVISYEGKDVTGITIHTTAPIDEGTLEFKHVKIIKASEDIEKIKSASELKNSIIANEKTVETAIKLENSETKAELEVNKESLSTVIKNNVEIKAVLNSNHEKYDLYKNPQITIELPEQVEDITVNNIDILYENELEIKNYTAEGRTIKVFLEGQQTQYKEEAIEGAVLVMDTAIEVNRKATTRDEEIRMTYQNQEVGTSAKAIKIVAPTDITTIYSIQDLGVETLGQEEKKAVLIPIGAEERQLQAQIEIINNNENAVENIRILGDFPTNHKGNNMAIKLTERITFQGVENAKIYYSENEEATEDLTNTENGWTESITNPSKVSKYLMIVNRLETGSAIQAEYGYQIPANLEYNQTARTAYQVNYTNSNTKVESKLASTNIEMQTGIGPKVETKLMATVGGEETNKPVRNGEVIHYQIEVSNTGTEDVNDVRVMAKVPEGTVMVVPEEDYEYSGASYYQELENTTYESTIETLKVGQVIYADYEVRVKSQVEEGTTLSNIAEVKYGDVTKQSAEIKNVTANGNLRITVKRVTDRNVDLHPMGSVRYYAIVENISDQKQENIKVQAKMPNSLQVELVSLLTGKLPNVQSTILEYAEELNIGDLAVGEYKILVYNMLINYVDGPTNFSTVAKKGNEEYQSNNWQDNVQGIDIGISMTANTTSQNVKAGDIIEYSIVLENKSDYETRGLQIADEIPNQLTIEQITQDGEIVEGMEGNRIQLPIRMNGKETTTVKIAATVDDSEARDRAEAITNVAYAEILGEKIATTSEINHIIEASENSDGNGSGDSSGDDENDVKDNDIAKGTKMISGMAWYDENANGQKDQDEKALSNIKVRLLNTQTNNLVKEENGKVLEVTTNENGIYVLDKIGNGKYIAIFDYDNSHYALTKYKVDKVAETENSNAILNELLIENERKQVASTDILEVQDNNISNINIGLIKLQNFDLKLDKYVSKILIQNANGTTVREYDNATMAKVELDAKTIHGSTVIIEYKIDVTNQGEIDGYAKKIGDYATSDLKFSSELNKDWYQVGDNLYTTSLANEKIKPGETKTLTLVLTKVMSENNTGLIPNLAEITEDYNELGIADSNSTPGNRVKGENDLGTAEVLLSIRTGGMVYMTVGIIIVAILVIITVIIIKKKNKPENNQ